MIQQLYPFYQGHSPKCIIISSSAAVPHSAYRIHCLTQMCIRDRFEYVDTQLKDIFAACDFMLSRAGANAIFELLALGKPALLIPLPKEQSRGDQILNANYFAKKGFSLVLMQEDLNSQTLLSHLDQLVQKRAELIRCLLYTSRCV